MGSVGKQSKFSRIRECINKEWFIGDPIRWVIQDWDGNNDYCIHCGNVANGVVSIKTDSRKYNLPFCNTHLAKLPTDLVPEYSPCFIEITRYRKTYNIKKNSKLTFFEWIKLLNKEEYDTIRL